jgi:hypothetical protein
MSVPVSLRELVDAFEFVSISNDYEHKAYICIATGAIQCVSGIVDMAADLPEDVEESDQYISVPHKHDLNLGRNLVFSFVRSELPDGWDTVSDMFRRRGAYRRFKDFLIRRDMSDKWFEFESKSTEEALRAWCEDNDIPLRDA